MLVKWIKFYNNTKTFEIYWAFDVNIYILERMKFYSLENIYGFDKIELHYPLILFIQLINWPI